MNAEGSREEGEIPEEEEYWRVRIPKPSVIVRRAKEILDRSKIAGMRCPKCGKTVSPNFKLCPYCGAPIEKTPPPQAARTFCQKCGKELSPDFKVCPNCGTPVTTTPQVPPPPPPVAPTTPKTPTAPPIQPAATPTTETHTPEQAMKMFKNLKARYESGALENEEYKSLLKTFKFSDDSGRQWTVGAKSETWYYHDGKKWIKGKPQGTLHRLIT